MKFGGTSVGNSDRIKNVASIVKSYIKKNPVVVVSAVTKITDNLIKLAKESAEDKRDETFDLIKKTHYKIIEQLELDKSLIENDLQELSNLVNKTKSNKNIDEEILDYFQSFGERISSKIVAEQLNKIGVKAKAYNSWELGFLTDAEFGSAEPLAIAYTNLKNNIKKLNHIPVITGFIGKTEAGDITTLGRGGSDYTAAIIGAAIGAEEIQIWTDVDGIMTTDPRIVKNAKTIEKVSFEEASELAYFGARVLHPKTILPAMDKNIPVKVLNSFNPKGKGTTIVNKAGKADRTVKAIACKKNITVVHIDSTRMLGAYGFLARIFDIFDDYKKSIDVVTTSEVSVSLTIDNGENLNYIVNELKEFADVEVANDKAVICVVGEGMKYTPGIGGATFTALGKKKINVEMISQGASKINVTFVVDGKDADKAVKTLHQEFFG
ncbi:lysine-sensitive aspartokinase 3 [Candidatus Woesearchaeota archaeon]|nr:lysine-sensitive aspartokinase 3 [Candidatus Woesearchaeota archaeon]